MKILFYGAGVLGSLYAARLQESGQEVSILARGQRLAQHGLRHLDVTPLSQRTIGVAVAVQARTCAGSSALRTSRSRR